MQAPLRDRDPRRLGPYRLTARLGRGGMGTVFLGEDDTGRRVAVKVINPELADDEAFHDRFRHEVTAARQVRRFCTAAVLDARLEGDPLYVVTEYVTGPSLDEAVKQGGPLRGGDLEALAVNIATALGAIHGAGIVHRDLKPSNVLLSPTGPRVIDFGIARALDASDGPTRTGQFVGTPAYIAPELMRGEEVTPAADVFSWGCVVAYAGTGRAPFGGGTLPETINRVTSADPDLSGLDPALHALVAGSLAKDPAERPTVKQLIQALTGEDTPPETPPATPLATPPPAAPPAERPTAIRLPAPEQRTTLDPVPPTHPAGVAPPPAPSPKARRRSHRDHGLLIGAMAAVVGISALIGLSNLPDGAGKPDDSSGTTAAADFGEQPPDTDDEVFDDKFSHEESGWPRSGDGTYRHRSYAMRLVPSLSHTTVAAPVQNLPDSQLMEVKIRLGGPDAEAGVFCRSDEGTGYAFLVRGTGQARIVWMAPDKLEELRTGFAATLRKDYGNRVQAACLPDDPGMRLGLWVNGEAVANTTDHEHADEFGKPGKSGLIVARAGDPSVEQRAAFDDFSLCSV
ncbi:serine/threonine-protein kinase [Actinomadura latina]|uniref:Serine/threonine protein kinase n=1 Tax=Actinomadura latina TaxID=163603 RepID=A0A846YYM6_9ACTN|nr:serine/threonine-protein kinase [Actinomadura latina]NKZ03705.1 serine/threonine protein kinase [Actinomadura latina]